MSESATYPLCIWMHLYILVSELRRKFKGLSRFINSYMHIRYGQPFFLYIVQLGILRMIPDVRRFGRQPSVWKKYQVQGTKKTDKEKFTKIQLHIDTTSNECIDPPIAVRIITSEHIVQVDHILQLTAYGLDLGCLTLLEQCGISR